MKIKTTYLLEAKANNQYLGYYQTDITEEDLLELVRKKFYEEELICPSHVNREDCFINSLSIDSFNL